jgi:chromosomal replication initiator protein
MITQQLSIIDIWQIVDGFLFEKLSRISSSTFRSSVKPISFMSNTLVLGVPNLFMKKWLLDKCEHYIKKSIKGHFDLDIILEINVSDTSHEEDASSGAQAETKKPSEAAHTLTHAPTKQAQNKSQLNPKYTFDSFVVGPCNRFPHAATVAVSKAPGKAYNPLFLYGGVGLGKTHLMHAVGNKVKELTPSANILYITAEDFTNDMINSLQHNKMQAFRDRYRSVDVLLIDDIQFIAGKEKTEEEFFHTFNYLHQSDKQIILTSDRPPKDIASIQDRLRSRFEWGLSADVQAPDLETRIAILYKKLEPEFASVPKDVIYFIASQIPENVRELEGALIKIIAYASLINQQITIALAKDVIKDIIKDKSKKPISLSKIKKTVSEYYDIEIESLSQKIRTKEIAHARQVAMFLARDLTNFSLPKIGESFGNRDHTTVMHACDKIRGELSKNTDLRSALNQIKLILVEQ